MIITGDFEIFGFSEVENRFEKILREFLPPTTYHKLEPHFVISQFQLTRISSTPLISTTMQNNKEVIEMMTPDSPDELMTLDEWERITDELYYAWKWDAILLPTLGTPAVPSMHGTCGELPVPKVNLKRRSASANLMDNVTQWDIFAGDEHDFQHLLLPVLHTPVVGRNGNNVEIPFPQVNIERTTRVMTSTSMSTLTGSDLDEVKMEVFSEVARRLF